MRDQCEVKPFRVENNTDSVILYIEEMHDLERTDDETDNLSSERNVKKGGYCEIRSMEA
jgi:hypothetical protein